MSDIVDEVNFELNINFSSFLPRLSTKSDRSDRSERSERNERSERSERSRKSGARARGNPREASQELVAINRLGLPITDEEIESSTHWKHFICGCGAGCNGCMYALFCPQCALATALNRYDHSNWKSVCLFFNPCLVRNIIREGYNIEGHCCHDICCSAIFTPCVINQLLAETAERGTIVDRWNQHSYRSINPTTWKFGLFDCCEDPSKLLYSCLMPTCALGSVRTDLDGSDWIFNLCFVNTCSAREMVRNAYNIEGTLCNDIMLSCFCGPCVITQMLIEVQHRGHTSKVQKNGVKGQMMVR